MTSDKQARKERPIARGVLDYFPDAIAEVAYVSYVGNQQHNPGQEMHWAKNKSADHPDCIARHLLERGTLDDDGLRHSAKAAWRALAMLQTELEASFNPTPQPAESKPIHDPAQREGDYGYLLRIGCPEQVAHQIVMGTTYCGQPSIQGRKSTPYVYIAGPMRGYEQSNFPAFDAAREAFLAKGFNVISPADIDRVAGDADEGTQVDFAFRDFWANYFLARMNNSANGIVLLNGWQKSIGASGEFFLDRWLGLRAYKPDGDDYPIDTAKHDYALAHSTVTLQCAEKPVAVKPHGYFNSAD